MKRRYQVVVALLGVLIFVVTVGAAAQSAMLGPGMMSGGEGAFGGGPGGLWAWLGWLKMFAFWSAMIAGVLLLIRALARVAPAERRRSKSRGVAARMGDDPK